MVLTLCGVSAFAQKFEEKQGRLVEPVQTVLARPLVVDLMPVNPSDISMQEYGPYVFTEYDLSKLTTWDIQNAKAAAVYNASSEEGADMIVGATFKIEAAKKGLSVMVKGYPVKYANWRLFGDQKTVSGDPLPEKDEYRWVAYLLDQYRINISNYNATEAYNAK